MPDYPYQHIVMDHFALNNKSYRVFAGRFKNWRGVYMGDSSEDYGIPETLTTDGGKNYTSARVEAFL